jgi:hypothetical protein
MIDRIIAVALFSIVALSPAAAQTQTFRNEKGQITGQATTHGNTTTYRDNLGREVGRSERRPDGAIFYDAKGRETGRETGGNRKLRYKGGPP